MQRHWLMRRNCSFTPKQVGLFYLAQSAFALLVAMFFLWQGVPFVLPFTILELFVLAIALLIYARHTTDVESIHLSGAMMDIRLVNAGFEKQYKWNVDWVVLPTELNQNHLIAINYRGQQVELGRFIHLSKRLNFLGELQQALKSIKFAKSFNEYSS